MSKKTEASKAAREAKTGRRVGGEISNNPSAEQVVPRAQLVQKSNGHAIRVENPTDQICAAAVRSGHRVSSVPKSPAKEIAPSEGAFPSRTKAKTAARSLDLEIE